MKTITHFLAITIAFLGLALQTSVTKAENVQIYNQPPSAAEMGKVLFGSSSGSSINQAEHTLNHAHKQHHKAATHRKHHRKNK